MDNNDLTETVQNVVKRGRPKGSGGNVREDKLVHTEPGENTKYAKNALAFWNLPRVNMQDENAVRERVELYINTCAENDMKPSVAGLAFALGVSREYLWMIRTGKKGKNEEVVNVLKRASEYLEVLMIDYMQNGKINPVTGIYLTKNFFGYVDKQEVVVTPPTPLGEQKSTKELEDFYKDSVVIDEDGTVTGADIN